MGNSLYGTGGPTLDPLHSARSAVTLESVAERMEMILTELIALTSKVSRIESRGYVVAAPRESPQETSSRIARRIALAARLSMEDPAEAGPPLLRLADNLTQPSRFVSSAGPPPSTDSQEKKST